MSTVFTRGDPAPSPNIIIMTHTDLYETGSPLGTLIMHEDLDGVVPHKVRDKDFLVEFAADDSGPQSAYPGACEPTPFPGTRAERGDTCPTPKLLRVGSVQSIQRIRTERAFSLAPAPPTIRVSPPTAPPSVSSSRAPSVEASVASRIVAGPSRQHAYPPAELIVGPKQESVSLLENFPQWKEGAAVAEEIRAMVKRLSAKHCNELICFTDQKKSNGVAKVYTEATAAFLILKKYYNNWPVRVLLMAHLKNTRQSHNKTATVLKRLTKISHSSKGKNKKVESDEELTPVESEEEDK
uniref:Uncharacterized protein n=1 Tax=Mycena chlorophos TaxID=658473 RepID=A0ABQ0L1E5_MYCCL|nr:predicted protein [Mycena chlorophos]